ncbi:hypothetical protein H6P81_012469 [Aristolochia fimbriata]|uniref:Uncharacterized protein n=1 Tax=Aristolochia fimbriata TaxID=158543 RepID=A0AAV7EF02_ARIFI|nr:hypothetical protein H6P81_012469 [Aristolochia fimbriata]
MGVLLFWVESSTSPIPPSFFYQPLLSPPVYLELRRIFVTLVGALGEDCKSQLQEISAQGRAWLFNEWSIVGAVICPLVCLVVTVGNSALILGLWPAHVIWTYYCLLRAKQLGPLLKLVMCIVISVLLVIWPLIAITASILGGAAYGFLAPLVATFDAVGEGKTDEFVHCIKDGTWSTVKGSCTVVRDFKDACFDTYFAIMDDLRLQEPPNGKPYEIRLFQLLGALFLGLLGIIIDTPVITFIAIYKSPYMLFKGWQRLIHDLIGREGPFLETACVPLAGLAILLWPLLVLGAVLASVLSAFFLGAYAAVIAYQESSIHMGLNYVVSCPSLFDEYSNDVLDMKEGSCFPRFQYQKKIPLTPASSFSRPTSFQKDRPDGKAPPSRSASFTNAIVEFKLLDLLDKLLSEFKQQGEALVQEGLITCKDIEEHKSSKGGNRLLNIGLPAYCILQALLRSANANSDGLLLSDNTEITTRNRPKDAIFDWFFNPLMIIKEQIKSVNLSVEEENHLRKLVLFNSYPERLKSWTTGKPPETERRRAEVDALARRLQGIIKSLSRYPTISRHLESLINHLSNEIAKKTGTRTTSRSRSGLARMFSLGSRTDSRGPDKETEVVIQTGLEV